MWHVAATASVISSECCVISGIPTHSSGRSTASSRGTASARSSRTVARTSAGHHPELVEREVEDVVGIVDRAFRGESLAGSARTAARAVSNTCMNAVFASTRSGM